ncbi:SGNH hydrolase domain-containing protein [Streptomyces sp. NBC_00237]|uniref:DUF459 domain-containing protein n=1 Tax=Streptomyces sp. NBC_00237 TaxID=2975687 RepID=UPI002258702D|nr:SGNH hydrolase domain-containing protein [Streptomyces sp. NBC_00237]MCX5203278.1 SGNH hydrolase domain-containing protein [Streptomyces sp. NBC_00237]
MVGRRFLAALLMTACGASATACAGAGQSPDATSPAAPYSLARQGGTALLQGAEPGIPAQDRPLGTGVPPFGQEKLDPAVRGKKVLVVGDSWAASIGTGMAAVAAHANTIVNAGLGGCGIMQAAAPEASPECRNWPENWARYVAEHRPDAVLLMTAQWDLAPQQIDDSARTRDAVDPVYRKLFADNLGRGARILSAGGATVFLMNSKATANPEYRDRALVLNDEIYAAAARQARTGGGLLDLRAQLCNDHGCPFDTDGRAVYDETGHPATAVRDRLAKWALNSMFVPKSAPGSASKSAPGSASKSAPASAPKH